MNKAVVLCGAFIFSITALNAMHHINFDEANPDTEMAEKPRFERHESPDEVIHFSEFSHNKVVNIIQAQNLFVKRTIQRNQNEPPICKFSGLIETISGYEEPLNKSEAALFFHIFSAQYHLIHRTPEEWLALANSH